MTSLRTSLAAVAALAVVVLLWRAWPEEGNRDSVDKGVARPDAEPTADAPLVGASQLASEGAARETVRAEVESVEAPADASEEAAAETGLTRSRVFGRIVDARGNGVIDVGVALHGHGRWVSEGVSAEELPNKYETLSDADGRFAFVVVTPTSDWVSLVATPGPYMAKDGRSFGMAGGRDQDPIGPGDNDIGTLTLTDGGAISGRVIDTAGAPVEGVDIYFRGNAPGPYTLVTRTDEAGWYTLGGLPAGRAPFDAKKKGYLVRKIDHIQVNLGQTTPAIDFTLALAPLLSGRITDGEGVPLEKVRLSAWPKGSGWGASTRTEADGTFTLELMQDEPYSIGAKLVGYEERPSHGDTFEPGTNGIELVMKRLDLRTLHVVDRKSGAPVERFGFFLSSGMRDAPVIEDHPGGTLAIPVPEKDPTYSIAAPGYADASGTLPGDPDGTLSLERETVITGRFTLGGEPIPHTVVRIQRRMVPNEPGTEVDTDDWAGDTWHFDVERFPGRRRTERGDEDGSFRIEGLAAGTYELSLSGGDAAPLTLRVSALEVGEHRDLGELAAHQPGEIIGVVLLTAEAPRAGLRVVIDDDDENPQVTDLTGTFRFGGLAEGAHRIEVESQSGLLLKGPNFPVELARGEKRHVQLDLVDRVPCRVEVRLSLDGLTGVQEVYPSLDLKSVHPGEKRGQVRKLGTLDADGRGVGHAFPGEGVRLRITGPAGIVLAESEPLTLAPGGRLERTLTARVGRLIAWLPTSAKESIPGHGYNVSVRATADSDTAWSHGRISGEEDTDRIRLDLGPLLPGTYEVQSWIDGTRVLQKAEVRLGETTEVTLADP